jgi:hypothetical protein
VRVQKAQNHHLYSIIELIGSICQNIASGSEQISLTLIQRVKLSSGRVGFVERILLDSQALAQVRAAALEMEERAYQISKEVFDQTPSAEQLSPLE